MHIGDMGASGVGDPKANFWLDGQLLKANGTGSHNNNTYPTDFQIGGYRGSNEFSKCEVAEVLIYKTVLSEEQRHTVQGYLAHKYKMAATLGANHPYKNEPPYFPAHAPEVLVSSEVKASVGNPWELKIEANNVATEFSAYDLPSWLQVDGQYLKGTPDAEGVFDITIAAGNANGSGVKKVKLTVTDFNNWPYSMDFTSKSLEPSSDNLVVHWKLDDESGTTAADSSGADPAVNGTATGGTVVNQVGKYGKAFKFDGVDDKVTHTLAANTTHAKYTVSIWAKPETVVQANYTGIFNSGNTGADFQLDIFDGEWRYAGDTAGSRILGSVTTDWTHIGITCDGTNTRMYLNGVLKHTIAKKDNVFQHYRLGANRAVSAHFKGLIDEVRIYNDALDSSIETLADVSLKNFPLLVRLRDGLNGFGYNQVKSLKGGDLRFLNTAGVELPYSIDVWNPDGESDIWVSVDQLRLQGGTKFTMYWGNPEATAVLPMQPTDLHGLIFIWLPT